MHLDYAKMFMDELKDALHKSNLEADKLARERMEEQDKLERNRIEKESFQRNLDADYAAARMMDAADYEDELIRKRKQEEIEEEKRCREQENKWAQSEYNAMLLIIDSETKRKLEEIDNEYQKNVLEKYNNNSFASYEDFVQYCLIYIEHIIVPKIKELNNNILNGLMEESLYQHFMDLEVYKKITHEYALKDYEEQKKAREIEEKEEAINVIKQNIVNEYKHLKTSNNKSEICDIAAELLSLINDLKEKKDINININAEQVRKKINDGVNETYDDNQLETVKKIIMNYFQDKISTVGFNVLENKDIKPIEDSSLKLNFPPYKEMKMKQDKKNTIIVSVVVVAFCLFGLGGCVALFF